MSFVESANTGESSGGYRLRVAEREGTGQVVDLSLFESIFSVIASEAAKTRLTGVATMRSGNQSTHTAPRNLYRYSDGGYVAMRGSMQSMAMRIFDTIGQAELKTDRAFAATMRGLQTVMPSTGSSVRSSARAAPKRISRCSRRPV